MKTFYCNDCKKTVNWDPMVARFWCDCLVMTEEAVVAATPTRWKASGFWYYTPNNPQPPGPPAKYPDKCSGCGKDMETMGLNRSYPPKRDGNDAWVCPHCGYLHLDGSASGTATWSGLDTSGLFKVQAKYNELTLERLEEAYRLFDDELFSKGFEIACSPEDEAYFAETMQAHAQRQAAYQREHIEAMLFEEPLKEPHPYDCGMCWPYEEDEDAGDSA